MNNERKPKIIDKKYVIEIQKNKLGHGSFGQVYLAYALDNPNIKLACKILSKIKITQKIKQSNWSGKQYALKYIIKSTKDQIAICQKIQHPNIVKFVHFSQTINNVYLIMQYCQGGDLANFICQKGTLQGPQALKMIRGIVSAASFLYDRNIIHRDIKPQNILISNGIPKLADFGFAKQVTTGKDLIQTGSNIGTMLYMAPQLLLQQKPHYSIKCDVWSIGLLMYFILYGHLPWGNVENLETLKLTLNSQIFFPYKSSVPPSLKNCISKSLIFDEKDRISIKKLQCQINQIINSNQMDIQ